MQLIFKLELSFLNRKDGLCFVNILVLDMVAEGEVDLLREELHFDDIVFNGIIMEIIVCSLESSRIQIPTELD